VSPFFEDYSLSEGLIDEQPSSYQPEYDVVWWLVALTATTRDVADAVLDTIRNTTTTRDVIDVVSNTTRDATTTTTGSTTLDHGGASSMCPRTCLT
jgi:hypothetical protein